MKLAFRLMCLVIVLGSLPAGGCRSPEVIQDDRGDPRGVGYRIHLPSRSTPKSKSEKQQQDEKTKEGEQLQPDSEKP